MSKIIKTLVDDAAKNFAGFEDPEKELSSAAQILGFRDANELVNNKIASGELIKHENDIKKTRNQKIEELIDFLKTVSEVNRGVNENTLIKPPKN